MSARTESERLAPVLHVDHAAGESLENALSPIALRSVGHDSERGRQINRETTAGSDRLPFEHDRDRILHCRQFRKLSGKTQLLIAPNRGDLRTRLTHTMEVYQLATSLARRLNLNIPAVEAIALGHDVGHTPFGHSGEAALDELLRPIGGFHHAAHSVRSLDGAAYDSNILHSEATCGLNLTWAVREGILKHGWFEGRVPTPYHKPPIPTAEWNLAGPGTRKYGSAEAQVVALADQIAYLNHDIDDLMLYGFEKILSKRIVEDFFDRHSVETSDPNYRRTQFAKQNFLHLLTADESVRVKTLVRDAVNASISRIDGVVSNGSDRDTERLIEFSPDLRETRNLFYHFFKECVYNDIRIQHKNDRAKSCVRFLFGFFEKFFRGNLDLLPLHIQHALEADTPWWYNYIRELPAVEDSAATGVQVELDNDTVACKLAAADVVADLTDHEALAAARALDEAESTSGMEALDRILATFPSERQSVLRRERQNRTKDELRNLFPVAGN